MEREFLVQVLSTRPVCTKDHNEIEVNREFLVKVEIEFLVEVLENLGRC